MGKREELRRVRSDVGAKAAYVRDLEDRGYESVRVAAAPADIVAAKDGETWFFEIKKTRRADSYFGAATLTEWRAAMNHPDTFRFVVAREVEPFDCGNFVFQSYTPDEFLDFSTIPPFKVYFTLPLVGDSRKRQASNSRKAIVATRSRIQYLSKVYDELREMGEGL